MSQAATTRAARRPWPKGVVYALWGILGILAATLLVFMLTLWFGGVHGTEFSPQTFERRSYSFYELPLVGVQVTAIHHVEQLCRHAASRQPSGLAHHRRFTGH